MKSGFVDKLIERLDRIDPGSLQTHFLHLAREQGLLETILHAIQEGVLVLDAEGRLSYANRAAERLLGFSLESARGQPVQKYLREIEWDLVLKLDESEWSRLVSREIEVSYPAPRFLEFYVVPLSAVNPNEEGAVVMLRDVTRDREDQASYVESERLSAVTLLAAGVAHEIGNPLNSLTIHLQLLEREMADLGVETRDELMALVGVARQEVTRLDQIITQFLRALRPTAPQREPASLKEVLDDTLNFLQHEIRDRDILVEVDAPEQLPTCLLDKGQVKQAFYNVIRNAIQAMPNGGLLKIDLSSDERFVGIAFKDSGHGIAPEDISFLFEPYHTTKDEGTGLGLMIVQRILRDHGGEIAVHSEPGAGTTFSLFFPRDEGRTRLLHARGGGARNTEAEAGP
jgi:PAS domain S-box-containing protein